MTRPKLLVLGLLALAATARAQGTDPNAAPACAVARDPQWVSPTGVLLVPDRATSTVLRWSLSTGTALAPIALSSGGVPLAYLPARDSLVIARTGPLRLTLRPLADRAPELLIALPSGDLCGLGATDEHVIVCVRDARNLAYLVYGGVGRPTGQPISRQEVGELPEPNDPNAPILPSWDDMAWDGEKRALYATRTQGVFLGALRVSVAENGELGDEVAFAEPSDPSVPRGPEILALLPGGARLLAPDGLILTTDPFEIDVAPEDSPAMRSRSAATCSASVKSSRPGASSAPRTASSRRTRVSRRAWCEPRSGTEALGCCRGPARARSCASCDPEPAIATATARRMRSTSSRSTQSLRATGTTTGSTTRTTPRRRTRETGRTRTATRSPTTRTRFPTTRRSGKTAMKTESATTPMRFRTIPRGRSTLTPMASTTRATRSRTTRSSRATRTKTRSATTRSVTRRSARPRPCSTCS